MRVRNGSRTVACCSKIELSDVTVADLREPWDLLKLDQPYKVWPVTIKAVDGLKALSVAYRIKATVPFISY
jgi:hypothetical protein